MDPIELIGDTESALAEYGNPLTLTRPPSTSVTVNASVRNYAVTEIVGGVKQGDRLMIISSAGLTAAAWPAPPQAGDQVVISGRPYYVMGVDAITIAGVDIRYTLQIRGDS